MKKIVELNYLTPLEFVAMYTRDELQEEGVLLEEKTKMSIIKLISKISENDIDNLILVFDEFSREVGYLYCERHNIFHEYERCPFCQLGVKIN
jgi:hypothetical protein